MLKNKYTPIKDRSTNEPILLGDKVKSERNIYGILYWDGYYNRYVIKTEGGGVSYATKYTKVKKVKKNNIDVTSVECRKSPNKKKW